MRVRVYFMSAAKLGDGGGWWGVCPVSEEDET